MVEYSEAPRFSYGWTLSVLPVVVWLDSQRHPSFCEVGLSEAPRITNGWALRSSRFSYGWTFRSPPLFV